MGHLSYKLAIVTGGADGLAAEAAAALAEEGAIVLITGTQNEPGEACATALRARGAQAEYHQLDPKDALSWAVLVDKAMRTHGHLDILVNHTGAHVSTTIEDAGAAQLRDILDDNLIAPFLGIKAVIPAMRQSGGGSIINITANPIVQLLPLNTLYGAAMAGLDNLTKNTALHCIQRGYDIRVNSVHPGTHETPLLTDNTIRSTTSPNVAPILAALPIQQDAVLYEFGAAIAYLAGDDSKSISGSEIFCRGALTGLNFSPV